MFENVTEMRDFAPVISPVLDFAPALELGSSFAPSISISLAGLGGV